MAKIIGIIGKNGIVSQALQKILQQNKISFIAASREECDIRSSEEVESFCAKHPFTHMINCSAYTAVDKALKEPEEAFIVNTQGVANVMHATKKQNIKLIHFSTDYVFDGEKKTPYLENDLVNPLNVYGKSKLLGEKLLLQESEESLVIRTSWVFSSVGHNFIRSMVRLMLTQKELFVVTDQVGKATYALDLARATLEVLDKKGLFHFANQGVITRYEYAETILKELRALKAPIICDSLLPTTTKISPDVAVRPSYSALDTTKIQKNLKEPIKDYKVGLKECLPIILQQEIERVS